MPLETARGKKAAIAALAARQTQNWKRKEIDNSSLHAGMPMYFGCISCNAVTSVPEGYRTRPKMCDECQAMQNLGWL